MPAALSLACTPFAENAADLLMYASVGSHVAGAMSTCAATSSVVPWFVVTPMLSVVSSGSAIATSTLTSCAFSCAAALSCGFLGDTSFSCPS